MINNSLFETTLIEPAVEGADELLVITGYSSPRIVYRQFERLKSLGLKIKVRVLVGMVSLDGIDNIAHQGFTQLTESCNGDFSCRYVKGTSTTHSKNYLWLKNGKPFLGFTGSANYSINAFSGKVIETLASDSPTEIAKLFAIIANDSVDCTDPQAPKLFNIFKSPGKSSQDYRTSDEEVAIPKKIAFQPAGLSSKELSLLTSSGKVHRGGGINWQLDRRDKNAAYIPVPAPVARSGFFPAPGKLFTVICDDGKEMVMTAQGAGGKQITTPHSNQELGLYLRSRMGVKSGSEVTLKHFENYGRTGVMFYKKTSKIFYMDFSV